MSQQNKSCIENSPYVGKQPFSFAWFENQAEYCLQYLKRKKEEGVLIVGACCDFVPAEIILAFGAVPVHVKCHSLECMANDSEHKMDSLSIHSSKYNNAFIQIADLIIFNSTCRNDSISNTKYPQERLFDYITTHGNINQGLDFWITTLCNLKVYFEMRYQKTISDNALRVAIGKMNGDRALLRTLSAFMLRDLPPLTGFQLWQFRNLIPGMDKAKAQLEFAINFLKQADPIPDAAERIRVMLVSSKFIGNLESLIRLIELRGGLVACVDKCHGTQACLEDVDATAPDPIRSLAEKYNKMHCTSQVDHFLRVHAILLQSKHFRAECIILVDSEICCQKMMSSSAMDELIRQETDTPLLNRVIDQSPINPDQLGLKIGRFFEQVRRGKSMQRQ